MREERVTRTVAEVEEEREEDEREGEEDEEEHAEGRRQSEEQDEGAGGGGRKDPEQSGTVDELTGRVGDHAEVTAGILIGRGKRMKSGRRERSPEEEGTGAPNPTTSSCTLGIRSSLTNIRSPCGSSSTRMASLPWSSTINVISPRRKMVALGIRTRIASKLSTIRSH